MNKFFSLMKVQLFSTFRLNKIIKSSPGKRNASVFSLVLSALIMGALIVGIGFFYANTFGFVFFFNLESLVPFMFSLSAMACLIFSFYSTGNALYGAKDYDLLSSLPIKKRTVILSKLCSAFVLDLVFAVLMLAPSVYVYVDLGGHLTLDKVARLSFMVIALPILPMVLSLILSALFLTISSRFKRASTVQTILFLLVFFGYMALSFSAEEGSTDVVRIYFFYEWVVRGFIKWEYSLLFLGVNIIGGAIVLWLTVITYDKINSIIRSKKTSGKYKISAYRSNSALKTLFKKEIRTLFSYSTYAMNALIGPIIGLLLPILLIFLSNEILGASIVFVWILPLIYPFAFMMAPTTNCSISIEGSSFWVIKTSPVKGKTVLRAKLMLNALFSAVPALISAILSIIVVWGTGIEYYVMIALIAIFSALSGGHVGLLLNLLMPKLKWENANRVAKQSAPVFFTMLVAFMMTAIVIIFMFVIENLTLLNRYIFITSIFGVLTIATGILIGLKGEKLLREKVQL